MNKNREIKKGLAMLMILSMTGSLTACSSSTKSNNTATSGNSNSNAAGTDVAAEGTSDTSGEVDPLIYPEETVTLTCYSQLANYSGEQTGWFAQVLLDKFNVKLNIIPDTDGVYDTRCESGDLGDLVCWGTDGDDYINAVNNGLLYDWNEDDLLTDYGPYIKENMQAALEKNISINPDGLLHGFGHNVATSSEDHDLFFYTWDLRWDLYKELGYPTINNLDDLNQLFLDMKEICPTDDNGNPAYAVSLWPDWDGNMVMYVKAMATAYYGYDELGFGLYDMATGTYHDFSETDGPYLTMLKFFNTLYQEGLLDPDSMTQTYDDVSSKTKNSGTFFSIFNYIGSDAYNTEEHMEDGKMMASMVPTEASPIVYGMNVSGGNRIWSIGAKTQYPELVMAIINWLATPEGRLTSDYGPKGVTWYYDENGGTCFTELGEACHKDTKTEVPEETGYYTKEFDDGNNQIANITWATNALNPESKLGEKYNCDTWVSRQTPATYEIDQDWRTFTGFEDRQSYMNTTNYSIAVGTSYSETAKSDDLKAVWDQVKEVVVNYSWKAIYAENDEEFDKLVAAMIGMTKSYGYDQILEWCNNEAAIRYALEQAVTQ